MDQKRAGHQTRSPVVHCLIARTPVIVGWRIWNREMLGPMFPLSVECHRGALVPQPPLNAVMTTSSGFAGFIAIAFHHH